MTFFYSIFRQWTDILPVGFTLEFYADIFTDRAFLIPLLRTLIISFVPVLICAVSVILAVYVTSIVHPRLEKIMQTLCTIPYALQGVILAISVLSLYSGVPAPFSNRVVLLTGTYCVVILPYMYRGILNNLISVDAKNLIAAAQIIGLSRFGAYIRVVVPNILKGVKISVMLSVSLLFGDFVIVNTIGGSYFVTAQVFLFKNLMRVSGQRASAFIIILFSVTMTISIIVFFSQKKNKT